MVNAIGMGTIVNFNADFKDRTAQIPLTIYN
jgi:hypothetical protein